MGSCAHSLMLMESRFSNTHASPTHNRYTCGPCHSHHLLTRSDLFHCHTSGRHLQTDREREVRFTLCEGDPGKAVQHCHVHTQGLDMLCTTYLVSHSQTATVMTPPPRKTVWMLTSTFLLPWFEEVVTGDC